MASQSTVVVNRSVLAASAIALVALGAAGAWIVGQPSASSAPPMPPAPAALTPRSGARSEPMTITLTKEASQRAGIEVTPVTISRDVATLRVPGVVQANAYTTVSVTPVTGGRVTRVVVELGQTVRRGQLLAEIYSPDLAEARMKYLSARAELMEST